MYNLYFLEEYFGARIYDPQKKEELFLDKIQTEKIKNCLLKGESISCLQNIIKLKIADDFRVNVINNSQAEHLTSPMKVSLNFTKECNLRCRHCLNSSEGMRDLDELVLSDYVSLFRQMKQAGSFFITFGGGEPLMRNDFFEVISCAMANDIAVSLVTNGLLVDDNKARMMKNLNLDTITVSIDGVRDNHEYIRGSDTYEKVINGIKILRKYCNNAKIAIRATINSRNINDYRELVRLAEGLDVDIIRFTPILFLGRAKDNMDLFIKQSDYLLFLEGIRNLKSKVEIIIPTIINDKKWFINADNFGCHCGKEACWIDQCGNFYPCIFFGDDYCAGNLKRDSFIDLWYKSVNMVKLSGNEECKNCLMYKQCRGGCRARALWHANDINAVDPLCPLNKNN